MIEKITLLMLFVFLTFLITDCAISQTAFEVEGGWKNWVQREAELQAQNNRMRHFQKCPQGFYAGVGYSTRSPTDAVRRCCYWNRNFPVRFFHVTRGVNGWYAAALYRAR